MLLISVCKEVLSKGTHIKGKAILEVVNYCAVCTLQLRFKAEVLKSKQFQP
jgi:hypothetical protein